MIKDNLYTGDVAREKLIAGVHKIASAVGGTMGTGGANSVIEAMENPGHLVTNDGFTIASAIRLSDPIEEMGRKILLEAISRANKNSGDGSSTTCVLTAAILEEGQKYLKDNSPMDIKRSLEECIKIVEDYIDKQKKQITVKEVGDVAAISAEDKAIGKMIQKIYKEIGKDGIVYWDISKTSEDSYTVGKGIAIEGAGFVSPYMADLDEKTGGFLNIARWKNVNVLLTKQKITSAGEFESLFSTLNGQNIKEIVVFCDEYEPNIVADLVKTRAIQGFKTLLIKMPLFWKDDWYQDLAKASGATIIDPAMGTSHKTMTMKELGKFGHITVSKEDTFIDGIADLTDYIAKLEKEGTDESKLRASRLNTKTARYFVGAHSESALSYRRLKVEDAISAAWQALNGGVVAGGGVALLNCAEELIIGDSIGARILYQALKAPMKQIMINSGEDFANYQNNGLTWGFDTVNKVYIDMFEAGITDPANVVKNEAKNAISVAAAILTANTVVTLPREENERSKMDLLIR